MFLNELTNLRFFQGNEEGSRFNDVAEPESLTLNSDKLIEYLAFGNTLEGTLFNEVGVKKPSQRLTFTPASINPKQHAQALANALRESCRELTRDELDYAVSLSGGMDSRSVLAAMPSDVNVRSFSFGKNSLELKIAREVARAHGVWKHTEYDLLPRKAVKHFQPAIDLTGGTWNLGQTFAMEAYEDLNADVVFDGWLTDSLLGGNPMLHAGKPEAYARKMRLFTDLEVSQALNLPLQRVSAVTHSVTQRELSKLESASALDRVDELLLNTIGFTNSGGYVYPREYCNIKQPHAFKPFTQLSLQTPSKWRYAHQMYALMMQELTSDDTVYAPELLPLSFPAPLRLAGRFTSHYARNKGWQGHYCDLNEWWQDRTWQEGIVKFLEDAPFAFDFMEKLVTEQDKGAKNITKILVLATAAAAINTFCK